MEIINALNEELANLPQLAHVVLAKSSSATNSNASHNENELGDWDELDEIFAYG